MRWWLTRRSGSWKVSDREELSSALRYSECVALVFEAGAGNQAQRNRALIAINQSNVALGRGDPDAAERELNSIAGVILPPKLESARLVSHALVHLHRGRYQACLDTLARAQQLHPDKPSIDLVKGAALNRLGRWADALERLQAYQTLLGDSCKVCLEMGLALRGVEAAFRKQPSPTAKPSTKTPKGTRRSLAWCVP